MDDFPGLMTTPTARRPLLGQTVLVVEDSRYACDAIRLLCLRSGARIRRADCLNSARRLLKTYRPSVVIVDMGLPDGSGAELIGDLTSVHPRVDVVIGISGDSAAEVNAMAAGADAFLAKPLSSLAVFQEAILALLPADKRPAGPRTVPSDVVKPDPIAYRDDLRHAATALSRNSHRKQVAYVGQFLQGIAHSAGDQSLVRAANAVIDTNDNHPPRDSDVSRLVQLLQDRIARDVAL